MSSAPASHATPIPHGPLVFVRAYIRLMKPNIIWLLLITTVPAMVVAASDWPSTWLVIATLIGGVLSSGGANAINQYADRDIDVHMQRTRTRPLPSGSVQPEHALWFGLVLSVASAIWLTVTVNWLSAALAVGAIGFYVIIYTYYLKRSTVQNIVIGGAAGAAPPLIGWAAVTGRVELPAIMLFLVVFYWTPPHFWALSLLLQDDYRRADVPMLPVVRGEAETKRQIMLYTLMLIPLTLVLGPVAHLGAIYFGTAIVGGAGFIAFATWLWRGAGILHARALFKYSTYYLALLFLAMAVDRLVLA